MKLDAEGIRNTQQLLEHTRTQKQRTELAHQVGTMPVAIKELANRADLMRLKGFGGDFSNLLEEAGVNSCSLARGSWQGSLYFFAPPLVVTCREWLAKETASSLKRRSRQTCFNP